MHSIANETPGCGPGARENVETSENSNPHSENSVNLKPQSLKSKVATLLSHALSPSTPPAVALATGGQMMLLLREAGITVNQVLAHRRIFEQLQKALRFLEKGDLGNCQTAIVVAIEWVDFLSEEAGNRDQAIKEAA
jgi:hypothetical protein